MDNIKKVVSTAIEEVEKEKQEKEVAKIKQIVQRYLEEIDKEKTKEKEHADKRRLLEKDLDDLKAGRLDKIEERQEKDEKAREASIVIIKRIAENYIPMQPWRSPWIVEWKNKTLMQGAYYSGAVTLCNSASNTINGTAFSNFATGTYQVGDHIINL